MGKKFTPRMKRDRQQLRDMNRGALFRRPGKGEEELEYGIASWGMPYERQASIGPYFVDFLIKPVRLVIEVDGPDHERQKAKDQRRTNLLENHGYRVFRVSAERAKLNPRGVANLAMRSALSKEEYEQRVKMRELDLRVVQIPVP